MARGDIPNRDISDTGFRCEPASNGGWVVFDAPDHPSVMPTMIAAYSNSTELLAGLAVLLAPPTPTVAPVSATKGAIQ